MESLYQIAKQASEIGMPLGQINTLAPEINKRVQASAADENVRKFGNLIARAEGTMDTKYGKDPYAIGFSGEIISDFSKHPNKMKNFSEGGKTLKTSAAGKYQFIGSTYDGLSKKTGVKDFSPESQEINFQELLNEHKVLDKVKSGDFLGAMDILGKKNVFASLPSSTRKQPKRSPDDIARMAAASGIDIGAAALGKPQPVSTGAIEEGFLPIYNQKVKSEQKIAQMQQAEDDVLAQQAAADEQAQQVAAADQDKADQALIMQARKDSIGSLLHEETLGKIGKNKIITTQYDEELLKIIRAA